MKTTIRGAAQISLMLIQFSAFAQFDCANLGAKSYQRNQTIVVPCDKAWLITDTTYVFYESLWSKIKVNDGKAKELLVAKDEYIKLLQKQIADQDSAYYKLKRTYNASILTTSQFIHSSDNMLGNINGSLVHVQTNLEEARTRVDEVKGILKDEMKRVRGNTWKWATGSALVGILVGMAIKGR